jgi:hypothetical protein
VADADPRVAKFVWLRYRSSESLLRHFKETSTLYLEIVDYRASGCLIYRCWRRITSAGRGR